MKDLLLDIAKEATTVITEDPMFGPEVYLRKPVDLDCKVNDADVKIRLTPRYLITKTDQSISLEVVIIINKRMYWHEDFRKSTEIAEVCEALEPLFQRAMDDAEKIKQESFSILKNLNSQQSLFTKKVKQISKK